MNDYASFLARKSKSFRPVGFDPANISAQLFPFQQDIVRWALRRGRACIFADCGMGKTAMQVEWARHVHCHTLKPVLILAPLAVAAQTVAEGAKFGTPINLCRDQSDVICGINVANYDRLHRFEPGAFIGVVLDESSIIKAHDGKTRKTILESFAETPYRLACTATPAPNDHVELGNHAEFVGAMSTNEMLATYFCHDGGETQKWRLKGHARKDFWRWVCSWAAMIRKPSDLGYDDGTFQLPPLNVHSRVVQSEPLDGFLFAIEAESLQERLAARRDSIEERVAECASIVNASNESWVIWCNLNNESTALEKAIPGSVEVTGSDKPEVKERAMLDFSAGKIRVLISKPSIAGFGMNWQHCANVAFVGLSDSWESYYQAVRRCWRFGQTRPVNVHIITADTEGNVVANIKRKEADAATMADAMVGEMADIIRSEIRGQSRNFVEYNPQMRMEVPSWLK